MGTGRRFNPRPNPFCAAQDERSRSSLIVSALPVSRGNPAAHSRYLPFWRALSGLCAGRVKTAHRCEQFASRAWHGWSGTANGFHTQSRCPEWILGQNKPPIKTPPVGFEPTTGCLEGSCLSRSGLVFTTFLGEKGAELGAKLPRIVMAWTRRRAPLQQCSWSQDRCLSAAFHAIAA